jgi:hypothetical protein
MEIESIAVICLIILVVLIVQIIVTLRLFLYLHIEHENDKKHGLRTVVTESRFDSVQEDGRPPSRQEPEVPPVPGPVYATSSRYSVQTDTSDSSLASKHHAQPRAPHPWDGTSPADWRKVLKDLHSGSGSDFGNLSCNTIGRVDKQNILTEVWARKPQDCKSYAGERADTELAVC